ncbi:dihydroxyacetone kinase subunit DhaL [Streptomyces sp. NPDC049040]|uniref:dihydroxyacetone kinase subunit DhaL n=1 Tax=Streptomyces sp. NPDC049040 TaxID=3365593 RepID=UPI0037239211
MSSPSTSAADLAFVVRTIARTAVDNEGAFGDLDAVAGDGDFGFSLARGFEIVLADWDTLDESSPEPAEFLKKVALVISKRVGGTSGPLWGTAFLRAAGAVKGRTELGSADAVAMLRAAAEGIKVRGKSDVGDKTLLDALIPMTDALEQRLADGGPATAPELAALAAGTARGAADATTPMQARRGRQSYTGERSIGSPDPGAVAVAVMAERVAAEWEARG